MLLAKKFGMEYTGSDNQPKTPYIIHRTSLGCYERTLALILEKYAGALPMWIAPTQAVILPINPDFDDYAREIQAKMEAADLRVELDCRNEKIGYRIREAQLSKVPYMLVVGANEQEEGTVSIRARKEGDGGTMKVDDMIARFVEEVKTRKR